MILSLNSIINNSLKERNTVKSTVCDQHNEIIKLIHHEFQKTHIKKLYPNPKWTYRAFWVITTNIEDNNEHIKFYDIIYELIKYLQHNNFPIPSVDWSKWYSISDEWKQIPILIGLTEISQRDLLKFIRESIIIHQIKGKSNIEDISALAIENGVTVDRFNEAIKQLKRQGDIFEPRQGFYKCI